MFEIIYFFKRINPNGDVIVLKELSKKLIYNKKKFNILDGGEFMIAGADAYFMEGCPVLRANTLHDIHNIIYIPNFDKPENSFWIHFVSAAQRE